MNSTLQLYPAENRTARIWPNLCLAGGMSFLAGATDAYGLKILRGLYVSFMSGNTTMLGVSVGTGDYVRSVHIVGLLAVFVGGAAICTIVSDLTGRLHTPTVILITSLVLCVPLCDNAWTAPCFVFAMGALNLALGKVGAEGVGLTYVTGALVKFGHGLGQWLIGRRGDLSWLIQGAMWVSILAGAASATLAMRCDAGGLWQLPSFGFMLAGSAFAMTRLEPAIDFHTRGQVPPPETRRETNP